MDLNQTTFSALFSQGDKEFDADKIRYIVLNCIRSYNMKFKQYGELIITTDSRDGWRKDVFPYYKCRRKTGRDKSKLNWTEIFAAFDSVKNDLVEYFPYPLIQVDKAEADDIIAVLARTATDDIMFGAPAKTLILSGDTDFVQLHDWNTDQYDPVRKKKVQITNVNKYLKEHIIEGDSGDDIPNVLSPDDTFVLNKRQKALTKKTKERLLDSDIKTFTSTVQHNYMRNKELIDLSCIPANIVGDIVDKVKNTPRKNKSKLFNYFYDRKLTSLIDKIQEF